VGWFACVLLWGKSLCIRQSGDMENLELIPVHLSICHSDFVESDPSSIQHVFTLALKEVKPCSYFSRFSEVQLWTA